MAAGEPRRLPAGRPIARLRRASTGSDIGARFGRMLADWWLRRRQLANMIAARPTSVAVSCSPLIGLLAPPASKGGGGGGSLLRWTWKRRRKFESQFAKRGAEAIKHTQLSCRNKASPCAACAALSAGWLAGWLVDWLAGWLADCKRLPLANTVTTRAAQTGGHCSLCYVALCCVVFCFVLFCLALFARISHLLLMFRLEAGWPGKQVGPMVSARAHLDFYSGCAGAHARA